MSSNEQKQPRRRVNPNILVSLLSLLNERAVTGPLISHRAQRQSRGMKIGQADVSNHRGRGLRRKLRVKKAWGG